jgi:hypothetical protein
MKWDELPQLKQRLLCFLDWTVESSASGLAAVATGVVVSAAD